MKNSSEIATESFGCAGMAHPVIRVRRPIWRALILSFALGTTQGCYVYTPVDSRPPAGTSLALNITDRGRVGLGDQVGPSAATIEGVLESQTDSAYVLNVTSVTYNRGQTQQWTGEPLTVNRDFVSMSRQRVFSRSRTALAAGVALGGILAFALSRGLTGSGNPSGDPPGTGEPGNQ